MNEQATNKATALTCAVITIQWTIMACFDPPFLLWVYLGSLLIGAPLLYFVALLDAHVKRFT